MLNFIWIVSASGANAGYVAFHTYPIFASDCSTIEESHDYDVRFIFYLLQSKQLQLKKLQTGGAQPHVYPEQLKNLAILFPQNKDEQKAIADILTDIDNEIETLQQQLSKYKLMKEGMMQDLLTGKVRLTETK